MKRSLVVGFLSVLAMAAVSGPALAEGNANFVVGGRWLSEDDWGELDEQGAFGVTVDFGKPDWPIHLEAGLLGSGKEEDIGAVDVTGSIAEVSFGVQKLWKLDKVRPFVGGGISVITAELEFDGPGVDFDAEDSGGAFYGHGGVYWRIGTRFNLGGDFRFLFGSDLEDEGIEGDADYFQLGLLLGWGWPAE